MTRLVWGNVTFCDHRKSPNTTKLGVVAGTGKIKWHLLFQKGCFWKPCSAEHTILSCFQQNAAFAERNERKLKRKNRYLSKIGGLCVCQHANSFLGGLCFVFLWCFVFLVFLLVFFLWKSPQKGNFVAVVEGCPPLFSQKPSLQNPYFLSVPLLFLIFLVSSPFKIPSFLFPFCPSTPSGKHSFLGGCSVFVFLYVFLFLMFVSVFQTNFPNMPFFKPNLLYFLAFFSSVVLCLCSCFMFQRFRSEVGFVLGMISSCSCWF